MASRRKFLSRSILGSFALSLNSSCISSSSSDVDDNFTIRPMAIATWEPNSKAVAAAWKVIESGGKAIDAVEAGVKVPEADPEDRSVGYGGRPDREGIVTLDACIMNEKGDCGSVSFLQNIKHPISVARKVMEDTPHVMLSGTGALQFALANGFSEENLLTEASKKEWEKWKVNSKYEPIINIENHDTIGMLAIDKNGDISGACTTSGMAYNCLLYTSPSPRDATLSRMPSSA